LGGEVVKVLIRLAVVLMLASCGAPVRYQKVDGPYIIVAADVSEDRSLNYDLGESSSIGRVESTVTGVGHDERYITVRRRPYQRATGEHYGVVEYYYVIRELDGPFVPPEALKGPFDARAFEVEADRLDLPDLKTVH
jgi:hypothetical protein